MAADPLFFCKTVAPGLFPVEFGSFHRALANDIINPKERMSVIAIARKHGKSTFIDVGIVLWLILHRGVQFIILASATKDLSEKFLGHIKSVVKSREFVKYYGDLTQHEDDDQWSKNVIHLRGNYDGHILHARIDAMGAGQAMPGQNVSLLGPDGVPRAIRPQYVIGDDLEDEKSVRNTDNIDKLENWGNRAVLPALHDEKSRYIVIGTPYAPECYLVRVMNYQEGVTVHRYPFVLDGDDAVELSEKLGLPVGSQLWPEYYSDEAVQKIIDFYSKNNDLLSYLLQYKIDTRAGSVWRFSLEGIESARYSFEALKNIPLNWFITSDFAHTTRKHSDKSAIALCALDHNKDLYVVCAEEGKWGDKKTAERVAEIADRYKGLINGTLPIYIETSSYDAVKDWVVKYMNDAKLPHFVGELKPANRPKENRIKRLIPLSQVRKLHLPDDGSTAQLEKQIKKFHGLAQAKNDDLLDALAYQMDVGYPASAPIPDGFDSPESIELWKKYCDQIENNSNTGIARSDNRIRRVGLSGYKARWF